MKSHYTKLLSVLALCLALGPVVRVQAQTYPSRPIKLLVPLAAGRWQHGRHRVAPGGL